MECGKDAPWMFLLGFQQHFPECYVKKRAESRLRRADLISRLFEGLGLGLVCYVVLEIEKECQVASFGRRGLAAGRKVIVDQTALVSRF